MALVPQFKGWNSTVQEQYLIISWLNTFDTTIRPFCTHSSHASARGFAGEYTMERSS